MPPPVVTSLTCPSPKLNVALLIVLLALWPFAVKLTVSGAVPVVTSADSAEQVGAVGDEVVVGVTAGVSVTVAAPVGDAAIVSVGTGCVPVSVGTGTPVSVGIGSCVGDGWPAGPFTKTVAGDDPAKTFSLDWSLGPTETA